METGGGNIPNYNSEKIPINKSKQKSKKFNKTINKWKDIFVHEQEKSVFLKCPHYPIQPTDPLPIYQNTNDMVHRTRK